MRNVTVALDETLLRRARRIAAERETSLNAVIRSKLEEYVNEAGSNNRVVAEALDELFRRSTAVVGRKTWSRDELYER